MENRMHMSGLKFKVSLLLPFLILICLFAAFWIATPFEQQKILREDPPIVPGDFKFFYSAHTVISTVNIALLTALLIIFINVYRKTRSEFSFGLILFGFAFLIKDLIASPFMIGAFSFSISGLGPFIVLPDLLEFAVLTILLHLNIKY
jgi:hypothetical protein